MNISRQFLDELQRAGECTLPKAIHSLCDGKTIYLSDEITTDWHAGYGYINK